MPKEKSKGGRPPINKEVKELEKKIEEFFASEEKPTITGLALALGYCDRQSIYDNEKKPEFSGILKKARLKVENSYEKALMDKDLKPTGAIFALKNMGWKDRQEVEHQGQQVSITYNEINGSD